MTLTIFLLFLLLSDIPCTYSPVVTFMQIHELLKSMHVRKARGFDCIPFRVWRSVLQNWQHSSFFFIFSLFLFFFSFSVSFLNLDLVEGHQLWLLLKICPRYFASPFSLWCFRNVTLSCHSRQCFYGFFEFCWGFTFLQSFWYPIIWQSLFD